MSSLAWTIWRTARVVVTDAERSQTISIDLSTATKHFVKAHQSVGIIPWLHLPKATDLVTDVATDSELHTVSAAASPVARLQAALELIMEKLLAQAQKALASKALTLLPHHHTQIANMGPTHACKHLSERDTVLCCVITIQKVAALFECELDISSSPPMFQSILAGMQTIFADDARTRALTSQPSVNPELLLIATQQTMQQLRDSITCWPDSFASCITLLMQLHRLDPSKLVIDQLVKQGGNLSIISSQCS